MCQRSSQGKPCGETLYEPPTAKRQDEWKMRESEQIKERKVGNIRDGGKFLVFKLPYYVLE